MVVISSFFTILSRIWSTLSLLKLDGVSWTVIVLSFIVVFVLVGGFFRARR